MRWIDLFDVNGNQIDLEALGLRGLKLQIPSPQYEMETQTIDGMDGSILLDQRLLPRNLVGEFWSKAENYEDSLSKRNQLYGMLGAVAEFYVVESHVPGKRWKVRMGSWDPKRISSNVQSFEIPMTAFSGKCESFRQEKKTFSSNTFQFHNEGSAGINMRAQAETEIEFRGASTNLSIVNKTTGDTWSYSGTTSADDVLLLKGVRSTKNGSSIFGQTNKKLISFAPAWNEFEVIGATDFEIEIRTKFYFL